jgi:hypothetical protein
MMVANHIFGGGYAFLIPAFIGTFSFHILRRCGDGGKFLKILAILGACFSVAFMILQLIPIPGLEGVHFGWQSYVMLGIWVLLGVLLYFTRAKDLQAAGELE